MAQPSIADLEKRVATLELLLQSITIETLHTWFGYAKDTLSDITIYRQSIEKLADYFDDSAEKLRSAAYEMQRAGKTSSAYWQGEAADFAHREVKHISWEIQDCANNFTAVAKEIKKLAEKYDNIREECANILADFSSGEEMAKKLRIPSSAELILNPLDNILFAEKAKALVEGFCKLAQQAKSLIEKLIAQEHDTYKLFQSFGTQPI